MPESFKSALPETVRMRAESLGVPGLAWIERLDGLVAELRELWALDVHDVFTGGSESLVLRASLSTDKPCILKIGLPGSAILANEAKVYRLAEGRGYASLLAEDPDRNAILLEKLGAALGDSKASYESQIETVCTALKDAWIPLAENPGLMSGAEKAHWLADFIAETWARLDRPCSQQTIDLALDYVEQRVNAHASADCVLVHGDAHPHNLLAINSKERETSGGYKFVDPDGLYAERACDLAVPMRDGSADLLAGSAVQLLQQRCQRLAGWTGVDETAIWQWGFVERISTGLTLIQIGFKAEGEEMLTVADLVSAG